MSEDIVNQAIQTAELTSVDSPAEQPIEESPEATPQDQETQDVAQEEPKAQEEDVQEAVKAPEDQPFPKKAVNALSRRDKQIGKLQAQLAAEREELQQMREKQLKSPEASAPKEESFDNYGEFLKAQAKYEVKQETSQSAQKQQEAQVAQLDQQWVEQRTENLRATYAEAVKAIPDYQQLANEHNDVLTAMPEHITRVFLELDNPALAFYALAKEGKIEAVVEMSQMRAAIEVGKAEARGETLSKQKPVTKAPAPMKNPLKGRGTVNKSLDTMSSDELKDWALSE